MQAPYAQQEPLTVTRKDRGNGTAGRTKELSGIIKTPLYSQGTEYFAIFGGIGAY